VDKENCVEVWKVLFSAPSLNWRTPNNNWLELWINFVQKSSTKAINMDVWMQTLKFAEESLRDESLKWWSEEASWPALVDEFVEHIREERGENGPEELDEMEY
jgi:DCN1-like protein 1/2